MVRLKQGANFDIVSTIDGIVEDNGDRDVDDKGGGDDNVGDKNGGGRNNSSST